MVRVGVIHVHSHFCQLKVWICINIFNAFYNYNGESKSGKKEKETEKYGKPKQGFA